MTCHFCFGPLDKGRLLGNMTKTDPTNHVLAQFALTEIGDVRCFMHLGNPHSFALFHPSCT